MGHNVDTNGSNDPPAGVPTDTVRMFRRVLNGGEAITDAVPVNLGTTTTSVTYHAQELGLGLGLQGHIPGLATILKVCAGGSAIVDWVEGGSKNAGLQLAISDFRAQLALKYPGVPVRWHFVWNQGETEAVAVSQSSALAWASNFATLLSQIAGYTGQATIRPHIVRIWHSLAGGTWLSTVRSQQASAASAASGYLLDVDSTLDGHMQSDDIHWTGAGHNLVGATEAASILFDISTH